MCCTAGLPMQIALSQLLFRAKPDRLLIEPTSLGHPLEVLQTLLEEHYRDVLSVHKILTLVDARKLSDKRYTGNATFNQQIAIADIIVGNKQDLYGEEDASNLESYIAECGKPRAKLLFTEQGVLEPGLLLGETVPTFQMEHTHINEDDYVDLSEPPMPECGFIKAVNHGEGFESIGWRFDATKVFDRNKLFAFLSGLSVERMKAVFITEQGVSGYNLTSDALTEMELDDCMESRIDIITIAIDDMWEENLFACLSTGSG